MIATTSSNQKAQTLATLGADDVINYRDHPQWGERVRALTDGRGVDRVIEVGGPATIDQSLRAVAIGGEVTLIGFLSEANPGIDYFLLKGAGAITRSITVGDRTDTQELVRAVSTNQIQPVIDTVFDFDDAAAAFDHLAKSKQLGKLVIRVN